MIERIRIVNLERSPQRLAQFMEWHPGLPIERFPAVDGATLDRDACIRDGIIAADNRYIPGALGCAMSHINLWRQCAAGAEPFHVAEDDIVLRPDFLSVASTLLGTLDAWDIVLWTHNFDWPVQTRPAPGLGIVVVQYDYETVNQAQFRSGTVMPALLPLVTAAGTGCYSVSPRGAARMLADCLPVGHADASYLLKLGAGWDNTGIDVEMSRHYGDWLAYVALPPLAVSANSQVGSTIRGHFAAMHDPAIANRAPPPNPAGSG